MKFRPTTASLAPLISLLVLCEHDAAPSDEGLPLSSRKLLDDSSVHTPLADGRTRARGQRLLGGSEEASKHTELREKSNQAEDSERHRESAEKLRGSRLESKNGEKHEEVQGGAEGAEGEGEKRAEEESEEKEHEEEGESEEEGGEEEEHVFGNNDVYVACMLIGGVSFVMVVLTIVNYEDDDIRRYSWALLSTVTSIFVSVMVFSSVNKWVLAMTEGFNKVEMCLIQYLNLFSWCCLLQVVLAVTSGSVGEGATHGLDAELWVIADSMRSDYGKPVQNDNGEYDESVVRNRSGTRSVMKIDGIEVPVEKKKSKLEQRHRRLKCWGTLLAHMCGFAAINAGCTTQQLPIFSSGPLQSLLPIGLNQLFVNALFSLFKVFRGILKAKAEAAGRKGVRAHMFDQETSESENDITCLAGSFLLVQSVRFYQVGRLPSVTGELDHTPWHAVCWLFGTAGIFNLISVTFCVIKSRMGYEEDTCGDKLLSILAGVAGMAFAWCCLFGSRTVFLKTPALDQNGVGMVTVSGRVLLALVLSLIATIFIFALDCIDDITKRGAPPGKSPSAEIIGQIVFAKSILIGFSWEHSFDGGMECISQRTAHPKLAQSAVALFMWFAVVPAWRRHILRKSMMLQDYYAQQTSAAQHKASGYQMYCSVPQEEEAGARKDKDVVVRETSRPPSAREVVRKPAEERPGSGRR